MLVLHVTRQNAVGCCFAFSFINCDVTFGLPKVPCAIHAANSVCELHYLCIVIELCAAFISVMSHYTVACIVIAGLLRLYDRNYVRSFFKHKIIQWLIVFYELCVFSH